MHDPERALACCRSIIEQRQARDAVDPSDRSIQTRPLAITPIFLEVASLPSHAVNPLPMEANSNRKTNCFFCFFGAPISPNLYHRNDMRHSYDRRQINRSRIGIAIAVQREIAAQAFIFPLAAFLHSDCFFRSARPVC